MTSPIPAKSGPGLGVQKDSGTNKAVLNRDRTLWCLSSSISYSVLTCILEDPDLMCCRLARNSVALPCSLQSEADPHQFQKRPFCRSPASSCCPPGLRLQCDSCMWVTLGEWFGGRGWDGQVSFHLEMFPDLTYHMNTSDDPGNGGVECGGKERGAFSAAEWISWIKVVV